MGHTILEPRYVFFFDIDNCLYSRNKQVFSLMQELIDKFFVEHLSLSPEDAYMLHHQYYKEYGLAIEGLTRHHKVNALEFNQKVDDALPLDDILKPDHELRKLLQAFDREKVKLWLFTNAHVTHGIRVVRLLGIDDLFEGITYCDYGAQEILCKPRDAMFLKAERESGASQKDHCYFVGMIFLFSYFELRLITTQMTRPLTVLLLSQEAGRTRCILLSPIYPGLSQRHAITKSAAYSNSVIFFQTFF